jgi:hypothetical protein
VSLNLLVELFSTGDSSLKCSLVTLRDRWLVITPSNTDHTRRNGESNDAGGAECMVHVEGGVDTTNHQKGY